mmetsp:Transcript_20844/g.30853  ORF Transcript_20844/g.30853 Transcript_20844/m.30853 type:complete len:123 (+) Transcript_20844:261-629(+)
MKTTNGENLSIESISVCLVISLACAVIVRTLITSFFVGKLPSEEKEEQENTQTVAAETYGSTGCVVIQTPSEETSGVDSSDDNFGWKCACEGGFLPPGLLKSFGNAESVIRLGTGQCYHKQS